MKITRRHVLAATAAAAAAAGAGIGAVGWSWWDRPPAAGLAALSLEEHAFAQALAEAWFPPGGDPALSGADAQLGDWLDGVIAALPAATGKQMKLLLHALDAATLPTHAHTFRGLPVDARTAVLNGWLNGDNYYLRSATQALLVLLGEGWTTHPQIVDRLRPFYGCTYGR